MGMMLSWKKMKKKREGYTTMGRILEGGNSK